jgi:nucleoside-diphosphate-sugar epimerase
LVGRHVVARLASAGHQVTALARRDVRTEWPAGVRPVAMDLLRPSGLTELLRGHDRVVHAAGPVDDAAGPAALRAVHVEGTARVADAAIAADVRVIVHISTLAVMMPPERGSSLDERAPLRERFPRWMNYARAKRDAERVLEARVLAGALRVCVLRPGIVLGEGDRHMTPRMLAALRRGWPVQVGSGSQRTPCVCASDLAVAVAAAILRPPAEHEAFVLSGPEPPTQADLWRWVAAAAGLGVPRGHVPVPLAMLAAGVLERVAAGARRPAPVTRFDVFALTADVTVDCRKAMSVLGWRPREAYSDAILAAVRGADGTGCRPEPDLQGGA